MVCQACHAPLPEGARFCKHCGAQVVVVSPTYAAYPTPPAVMYVPRVNRHLQTLGILWCVWGAYRIIGSLVGMFALRAVASGFFGDNWPFNNHYHAPFGHAWMGPFLTMIAVFTMMTASLAIIVGYGLLTRRPWGRTLAIIVAVLALLKPLFGTALGIYTLWVLTPSVSAYEYDSIADHS